MSKQQQIPPICISEGSELLISKEAHSGRETRGSWSTIKADHYEIERHITGTNHTLANLSTKHWIPATWEEI